MIILALAIAISGGTISFAQDEYSTPTGGTYFNVDDIVEVEDSGYKSMFFNSTAQTFEEYIIEKCLAHETIIDVSAFNITPTDFENKYFDVILRHPELMVVPSYRPYANGGIMIRIAPVYYFSTVEESLAAAKQLENKVNEYVSFANRAPDDLGKLLLVHDKIAYDYSYEDNSSEQKENGDYFAYHPYGFILRDKAVCQGYAGLLYAVATKLGIEADFCNAKAINHIWNFVKIDEEWYHIDMTWDDPTVYTDEENTQLSKSAYHRYFMRSDSDFAGATTHGDVSTYNRLGGDLYECTSNRFENNHLFNLPLLCLVSYADGNYRIPCGDGAFEYPTLYTGPMLVTKPYKTVNGTTPINAITYIYTGNSGRGYLSVCRRIKNGNMAFGQFFSATDNNLHYSTLPVNKDGAEYSFYFFDRNSLAPLSVKRTVVDN